MKENSTLNPLVSIIIPIFNMEEHLRECLESILHQSYQNIQIILVDDGSMDSSGTICQEYVKNDKRFELYRQKNGGVAAARNFGLSKAEGSWIMFVDPDDKVEIDIIEKLFRVSNDQTDIICCCCKVNIGEDFIVDHFLDSDRLFSNFDEKTTLLCQLMDDKYNHPGHAYTAIGVPWGKLYRKSFLDDNKLVFDESLLRMQDLIFNAYAFYYARQIFYLNKPLYIYRFDHISRFLTDYAE